MNCKPGDLAIVIRSFLGESTGAIVEVVSYRGVGNLLDAEGAAYRVSDAWLVRSTRPLQMTDGSDATEFYLPDAWLRPVSGLPDTEDTDTEQPIKETA